jgi:hypothetical protein
MGDTRADGEEERERKEADEDGEKGSVKLKTVAMGNGGSGDGEEISSVRPRPCWRSQERRSARWRFTLQAKPTSGRTHLLSR